jgi:hypothetical protein
MKRSTGFRDYLLATGSAKNALANTVVDIFGGAEPVSADSALGAAVHLCRITVDGLGTAITMNNTSSQGQLTKNTNEVWRGSILASGTPSFFRQTLPGDAGDASSTAIRIQGSVGIIGTDLQFSDIDFLEGDERKINFYVVAITAG